MISRETLNTDGEVLERQWIDYNAAGNPWYWRWSAPDLTEPVESRAATAEETNQLKQQEEGEEQQLFRRRVRRSLTELLATANGNEVVTLVVALGLVPPKGARAAGWIPPGR